MQFKKEELIKSPLNYTGGKYKLLPQILPYFPDDINTFVDLFTGGCNVGINVKANNIICNDVDLHVVNLLKYLQKNNTNIIDEADSIINKYKLNKENKMGYMQLRNDYNIDKNNLILFLVLIFHSFNNQIRFNKKGEFNLPFGGRTLNCNLKNNLSKFLNQLNKKNINFLCDDFEKIIKINNIKNNDFVYCDPPYSLAFKEYNGQNFWSSRDDRRLFDLLDALHAKNIKFALSNVFECKGRTHNDLIDWSKKYNVIHLNTSYKNCNYVRNNKKDDEVLIFNY